VAIPAAIRLMALVFGKNKEHVLLQINYLLMNELVLIK